jgi:serine/threonine protein phosphatase PrpC
MIRFSHGAATSAGRVRRVNEDSYLAAPPLFVVADGMGGHGAGNVASRIAIEEMTACVALRPLFAQAVLTALEHANRHIIERDQANRMGTTVVGLAALETAGGDQLMVFNVGDSRVYRLAGNRIEQLTVDHSEVQELVLAGVITREQARTHPRRNIVTRALGADVTLRADHWLRPAIAGERYLICSDGLFGELPDEVILALLAVGSPQQAADALVSAANDAGGRDNVTVVIVDITSGGSAGTTGQSARSLHSALPGQVVFPGEAPPAAMPPREAPPREAPPRGAAPPRGVPPRGPARHQGPSRDKPWREQLQDEIQARIDEAGLPIVDVGLSGLGLVDDDWDTWDDGSPPPRDWGR